MVSSHARWTGSCSSPSFSQTHQKFLQLKKLALDIDHFPDTTLPWPLVVFSRSRPTLESNFGVVLLLFCVVCFLLVCCVVCVLFVCFVVCCCVFCVLLVVVVVVVVRVVFVVVCCVVRVGGVVVGLDHPPPDPPPPDHPKFRSFFPSLPTISFFFSLNVSLLVEFWWCFWRPGTLKCARLGYRVVV